MNETQAINNSYDVRDKIAVELGKAQYTDWTAPAGSVLCVLDDDTSCYLLSTTNAGFRGIEGRFVGVDSDARFTKSLGRVVEWEVWL